jgi:hypothetical protein
MYSLRKKVIIHASSIFRLLFDFGKIRIGNLSGNGK